MPYRVIGVEAAKGTVFGIPQDTFIIIPLKTYSITSARLSVSGRFISSATSRTGRSIQRCS